MKSEVPNAGWAFGIRKIKSLESVKIRGFQNKPGNVLLSRGLATEVPSTLKGLTAVFGMGTGVAPSVKSPEIFLHLSYSELQKTQAWNVWQ